MNQSFNQTVEYILDKAHFQECFEQSAPPVKSKDFAKAAIMGALGIGLLFVEAEHYYIQFFLISLAILEVLSIIYRKTWWVWRQLMGKTANGKVTLVINDKGFATQSNHITSEILWDVIDSVEKTEMGLLLRHKGGANYLSNQHLSDETINFILNKVPN